MVDDLGYNDVSFRGSNEIPTPNIDSLAYNGMILNRFYTPTLCTPSRSAMMTGKYPHRLGMQELVISSDEPWGLPLNETLMPEYFKSAGYKTHLIGKWHLGFHQQQYTPSRRGYDSFFGYFGPYIDYFSYELQMFDRNYSRGYDLRRNLDVVKKNANQAQTYATNLFTDEAVKVIRNHDRKQPLFLQVNHLAVHAANDDFPLQARLEDIQRFSYINNTERRTLAAMIYQLDLSVGEIVKSLKERAMLQNTIIVFYSDNPGPTRGIFTSTTASNYPLRGQKFSAWEGGIRSNAIIYAPFLPTAIVRNEIFYVADLLPTLNSLSNAGFRINPGIDGIDQSSMLRSRIFRNLRREIVSVDDVSGYSSFIYDNMKIVNGSWANGAYDIWLGSNNNSNISLTNPSYIQRVQQSEVSKAIFPVISSLITRLRSQASVKCGITQGTQCNPLQKVCLFNLTNDPCEYNNIADRFPDTVKDLQERFNNEMKKLIPSRRKLSDPACNPKNFNFNWNWWQLDSYNEVSL